MTTRRRRQPQPLRMNNDRFPPIFAVTTVRERSRSRHRQGMSVWVFTSESLQRQHHYYAGGGSRRDHTYRITPHRIRTEPFSRAPPAFYIDHDIPNHAYHWDPVTLVFQHSHWEDYRHQDSIQTRWRYSGTMIYSMSHPDPIPLLDLERGDELLQALAGSENELRVYEGTRGVHRVWERRWDYTDMEEELAEEDERRQERRARRAAAAAAAVAVPAPAPVPAPTPAPAPTPIPKFVADLLIADAVAKSATCPITMEPLKIDTAAVTTCFHIFDANAIASWLTSDAGNGACAVCRKPTTV